MKQPWIMPLVAAAAAGAVAYGVTRTATCGRAAPSADRLQDVVFLTRELGLDDVQAGEVEKLHKTLGTQLGASCARHCAARAGLGQALAAGTNDDGKAEAIVAEMCRAYGQSERATLDHIRAVRAVLNAGQRRRFDAMISECMCRPCRLHGGGCRTDADSASPERSRGGGGCPWGQSATGSEATPVGVDDRPAREAGACCE